MRPTLKAAALFAVAAVPAQAATINVTDFSTSAYNAAVAGMTTSVSETFEGTTEGNVANGFATAVGSFATIGGTGSGGTVNGSVASGNFAGNDGSMLALRDGNVFGRTSTTASLTGNASNDMFLDSNDTFGISWTASMGGTAFDRIALTLMDAAEFGGKLNISVGAETYSLSGLSNGATKLVEIVFDSSVTTASILFSATKGNGGALANDGFSIDDIAVGSYIGGEDLSAVPLPAGVWLMLTGFGGFAALRRRQKRQA